VSVACGATADGGQLAIECAGEELLLHHDRALYWPRRRMLLVADVHLGKEWAFGRAGLAVPGGATESDLGRLDTLVRSFGAEELAVLGDFTHAPPGDEDRWLDHIGDWLHGIPAEVSIVAGNHDRPATRQRMDRRIRWYPESRVERPFVLQHEPEPDPRGYGLGGHLHPAMRLRGGGDSIRLPVFWFLERHAVLPAFGSFTGARNVRPGAGDRVYAIAPDAVVALPAAPR
jgi:DNA ligase-associated metallophosphoesterase